MTASNTTLFIFLILINFLVSCSLNTPPLRSELTQNNESLTNDLNLEAKNSSDLQKKINKDKNYDLFQEDKAHIEILAVSGGGHRAAHYSLGVLLGLDDLETPEGTLLDEIDMVSSVSGGTYGTATYLAAFVDKSCALNRRYEGRALDLLKENRARLNKLSEAWWPDFLFSITSLAPFIATLNNFDFLEKNYHYELTKLEHCKNEYLRVGDVIETSDYHLPFFHIINATNSVIGSVEPFARYTENGNQSNNIFTQINCMAWRGKFHSVKPEEIPYSLATTSSASFPPLVTDALFASTDSPIDCENGNINRYIRLTDGGQADDNGIDTALNFAGGFLSEQKSNDQPLSTMIISMDALIDSSYPYSNSDDSDGFLKMAILRNADIPRYNKKRKQKNTLFPCDDRDNEVGFDTQTNEILNTCEHTKLSEWQTFAKHTAIFGTSIGFYKITKEEEEYASTSGEKLPSYKMAFDQDEYSSDISTFENTGGLDVPKRIAGVAEGYYQTIRKLIEQSNLNSANLKLRARLIAFELYCENHAHRHCTDYFNKFEDELGLCFSLKSYIPVALADRDDSVLRAPDTLFAVVKSPSRNEAICSPDMFKQNFDQKGLVVFNDQQRTKLKNKRDVVLSAVISTFAFKANKNAQQKILKFRSNLENSLAQLNIHQDRVLTAIRDTYLARLLNQVLNSDFGPEVVNSFNKLNTEASETYEQISKIKNNIPLTAFMTFEQEFRSNKTKWTLSIDDDKSSGDKKFCVYESDQETTITIESNNACKDYLRENFDKGVLEDYLNEYNLEKLIELMGVKLSLIPDVMNKNFDAELENKLLSAKRVNTLTIDYITEPGFDDFFEKLDVACRGVNDLFKFMKDKVSVISELGSINSIQVNEPNKKIDLISGWQDENLPDCDIEEKAVKIKTESLEFDAKRAKEVHAEITKLAGELKTLNRIIESGNSNVDNFLIQHIDFKRHFEDFVTALRSSPLSIEDIKATLRDNSKTEFSSLSPSQLVLFSAEPENFEALVDQIKDKNLDTGLLKYDDLLANLCQLVYLQTNNDFEANCAKLKTNFSNIKVLSSIENNICSTPAKGVSDEFDNLVNELVCYERFYAVIINNIKKIIDSPFVDDVLGYRKPIDNQAVGQIVFTTSDRKINKCVEDVTKAFNNFIVKNNYSIADYFEFSKNIPTLEPESCKEFLVDSELSEAQ